MVFRFVDFDGDGLLDLLAASKGGIYYLKNNGDGKFIKEGYLKDINGAEMLTSCSSCDALAYIDINGDGSKDIITNVNNELIYYPGVDSNVNPKFGPAVKVPDFVISTSRLDIADIDKDGLLDVMIGDRWGDYYYFKNIGSVNSPLFDQNGVAIKNAGIVGTPYNTHPRVIDYDHDGTLDILYGINWSYLRVYLNKSSGYQLEYLKYLDNKNIALRNYLGDNTAPDVGDVNNDGVIDIVTSGKKGKVVILLGLLKYKLAMQEVEKTMALHPTDLGTAMKSDDGLWNKMYDLHTVIQTSLAKDSLSAPEKQAIYEWYAGLVGKYPNYLTRKRFEQPNLDCLAGYIWMIMLESRDDTAENRAELAQLTKHTGPYESLLKNQGIILIDNNSGDQRLAVFVQKYMESLNPDFYSLEAITVKGLLTNPMPKIRTMKKSKVNIFKNGFYGTNQFPNNCEVCKEPGRKPKASVFMVVVAHEVGHNSLDQRRAKAFRQELKDRKHELIRRTAGPEIKWKSLYKIDSSKTEENFREKGWWDGEEEFGTALKRYFKTGPGVQYDMNHLRQMISIDFFIWAPQEAFATLSNQYFDDSKLMLDYAWEKALKGYILNVDWFLLCAEYYSLGTNTVPFWSIDGEGNILTYNVTVGRSTGGYINKIMIPTEAKQPGKQVYEIQINESDDGFVKAII